MKNGDTVFFKTYDVVAEPQVICKKHSVVLDKLLANSLNLIYMIADCQYSPNLLKTNVRALAYDMCLRSN